VRPDRLPPCAAGIIERSRVLPAGVKLVWLKMRLLDQATEGCTMRSTTLADELGMADETVTRYQRFLQRAALLVRGPRVDGRAGSTWYATLPTGCAPANRTRPELARCGQALDVHLRAQAIAAGRAEDIPARAGPPDRRIIRAPPDDNPPPTPSADRNIPRPERPHRGGSGGVSDSRSDGVISGSEVMQDVENPRCPSDKPESNAREATRIEAHWMERFQRIREAQG
jgi:hypothetical protein